MGHNGARTIIGLNPLWNEFANQMLTLILLCNLLNWFLFAETSFCCNLALTLHVAILSWSLLCNNIFYADSLLYYIQLEQKVCNFLIKIGHHDMGTVINPTKYNKGVRWGVSILKMLHNGLESFWTLLMGWNPFEHYFFFKVLFREILLGFNNISQLYN